VIDMASARPVHVLMTADALGDVWTYATTLMDALQPAGVTFTLAVMGPPPSEAQRERVEAMSNVRLRAHPYRLEWMPDCDRDVHTAGRWLQRLVHRIAPDVVHVNGYAHAALPFGRPTLSVAHGCVRSWWRAVKHEPAPDSWNAYTRRVQAGLAASTRVVAPTLEMAESLRREYAFNGPITVIANGLPPAPRRYQLASYATKESCIFAASQVWDEAKNLAVLDQIAAGLPWPMIVAGDIDGPGSAGPAPRHLWQLGSLDRADLLHRLARAAIYVDPARYEPLGLDALEAAQAGCVLVLGDIPSLREIWGDAAIYADPDDRAGLRHALNRLIADRPLRARLAAAARARAGVFTDRRMAYKYLALYQRLAAMRDNSARELFVQTREVTACGS
jgi:glycogen(starch) synthase